MSVSVEVDGQAFIDNLAPDAWPDLVLMDCEMPRLDGFDATLALRSREQAEGRPPTPVVAMTAHVYREAQERCQSAGMDDFLAKPLELTQLDRTLDRWLQP